MTEAQGVEIIALLTALLVAVKVACVWLSWLFGLGLVCGGWALWREFMEGRRIQIDVPRWRDGE